MRRRYRQIAVAMAFWFGAQATPIQNQHVQLQSYPIFGDLPQHLVPPLIQPYQGEIPFSRGENLIRRESMIEDTFHFMHVQGGQPNNPTAKQLFQRIQSKAQEASTVSADGAGKSSNTSESENAMRRSLLRGWFGSMGQNEVRLLGFSTDNDFVVKGEVDLTRSNNDTDPSDDNSTSIPSEVVEGGGANVTAAVDEDSSTVLTKSDTTEPNNVTTAGDDEAGPANETGVESPTGSDKTEGNIGPDDEEEEYSSSVKYHPIRIRAVLSEYHGGGEHLDSRQLKILLEDMVQPALLAWSEALRVPVGDVDKNLTLDPKQWIDGATCGPGVASGLPTAHIPLSHLKYGVPETDLVVYINLGFVYEPTPAPTPEPRHPTASPATSVPTTLVPTSDSTENSEPPAEYTHAPSPTSWPTYLGNASLPTDEPSASSQPSASPRPSASTSPVPLSTPSNWSASTSKSTGRTSGTMDGDLENFFTPPQLSSDPPSDSASDSPSTVPSQAPSQRPKPRPKCAGDYLASSVFCSTDELDRPTAALLHICIGPDFFDRKFLPQNIMTMMHELGHALGFNLQSLAHFRRPDGSPITRRDDSGAIPTKWVECTGPKLSGGRRPWAKMQLPSRELLQFRIVRGGVRVAEVVTPSVAQVARNHFDCQELAGAELESGEALPLSTNPGEMSCIGNHWERRLFKMDLMNPIVDELTFDPFIPILTLAYFADSGWYQVDLSRAALPAIWGRAAGCAFVEEPCIQPNGQVVSGSDSLFCNSLSNIDDQGYVTTLDGCTPDLTRKAACTMNQYDGELPPQYQYFSLTYGSNVGGLDPFMDYCPVFNGLKNGLCSDPGNEALLRVSPIERVGSKNSRCLSSHSKSGFSSFTRMAMCLRIACVVQDKSLFVQVEGKWRPCSYEGQPIVTSDEREQIICPDPVRVCPTFYCARDCLGTGRICNYTVGECMCTTLVGNTAVVQQRPLADGNCPGIRRYPIDPLLPEDSGLNGTDANFGAEDGGDAIFFFGTDPGDGPLTGTPLDDIYFADLRKLEEEEEQPSGIFDGLRRGNRDSGDWQLCFLGLLILLLLPILLVRKRKLQGSAASSDDANDGDGPGSRRRVGDSSSTNFLSTWQRRNKDKMIATVLVDLRMNDHNLENFRDVLVQRGSETDRSMTDTDPGSFVPWDDRDSREFTLEQASEQGSFRDLPSPSVLEPRIDGAFPSLHSNDTIPSPASFRDNDMEIPTTVLDSHPSAITRRNNATIRRRFFRRRYSRMSRNRSGAAFPTDTLRI